jgi:hypothetical protein
MKSCLRLLKRNDIIHCKLGLADQSIYKYSFVEWYSKSNNFAYLIQVGREYLGSSLIDLRAIKLIRISKFK